MTATFAVIDVAKYKVTLDPATVTLAGDDATVWTSMSDRTRQSSPT